MELPSFGGGFSIIILSLMRRFRSPASTHLFSAHSSFEFRRLTHLRFSFLCILRCFYCFLHSWRSAVGYSPVLQRFAASKGALEPQNRTSAQHGDSTASAARPRERNGVLLRVRERVV